MSKERAIFDFSNAGVKRMAKRLIDQCDGLFWWELSRARDQRSLEANGYYWGVVLPYFAKGLTDAWGETWTADEAHEECRKMYLTKIKVNQKTGEVTKVVRSTTDLDVPEFGEYLDKIIKHAAEYLNTDIPIALKARKEVA
jgi:hypothetical protein